MVRAAVKNLAQYKRCLAPLTFAPLLPSPQVLDGVSTYLCCLLFEDRVFITASQFSTFGTLVTGSRADHPDGTSSISVRTVLGAPASEEHADGLELVARRLVETCHARYRLPLFLGCGLRNCSLETARAAVAAVEALLDRLSPLNPPAAVVSQG